MKRWINLVMSAALALALAACAGSAEKGGLKVEYETYRLANGLKVVLHQDHSDPIVAVAIQFHVGSGREKVGKTGFAHFFEHMLFQRSENLPRNAFFQNISDMGGSFNGGTWQDGTIYYETVPRDALEKVLWMESDRMGFFINTVTQAGVDREIDVILNEKRQTTDNTAYGQLNAIQAKEMYPKGHPYSWTVIGEMDDIRSATIDDVREFYHTYYIPQNATMVLAGDFDPTEAKALIEKYFGEIAPGNDVEMPTPRAAVLAESKNLYYEDPFAPLPLLMVSYPGVEQTHADAPALDMLAYLLGGSKDSPLHKTIVEANLAPSASVYNSTSEVAGEFEFRVNAFSGVSLNDVNAGIEKAMQMFEEQGVDEEQMAVSKAMREVQVYSALTSVNGKAMLFAQSNEFFGRPDSFIEELEAYKAVTAQDVMRVYNQYVKGKHFLAVSMVPKGQKELVLAGAVEAHVDVENVEDASSGTTKSQAGALVDDDYPRTPSKIDRSVEPSYMANTPSITLPAIWKADLGNGMKLQGITHQEIPTVSFNIMIPGGLLLDPADKPGVAYLNAAMMNEGTSQRTAEEVQKALNLLGASVRVSSSRTYMEVRGTCLSKNFDKVMSIVQEIITSPRFDEETLEREKNKALASMQQAAKNPNSIATSRLEKLLFGDVPALTLRASGTEESIASITLDDVKTFHREKFSPRRAAFNVAGDITPEACRTALASLADAWQGEDIVVTPPAPEMKNNGGKVFFVDYPGAKQSVIMLGGKGMPHSDPANYGLQVLNYKLGAGSNGELFNVLRLQRGYTYGAYSSFASAHNYGLFRASSSVQSTVTKESLDLFREIISGMGPGYTGEMLAKTKDAMLRSMAFSFETQSDLIGMLDNIFFYNLPDNYVTLEENTVKNITLDDIKKLAAEYLDVNNMTIVVVGDAKTQLGNLPGAVKME